MWVLGVALLAFVGWCWWTRRLRTADLLPAFVALLGASFAMRGSIFLGLSLIGGAAAYIWLGKPKIARTIPKQSPQLLAQIELAETLLGISAPYDKAAIDEAFKQKAKQFHPDIGGDPLNMTELNKARKLLLDYIS